MLYACYESASARSAHLIDDCQTLNRNELAGRKRKQVLIFIIQLCKKRECSNFTKQVLDKMLASGIEEEKKETLEVQREVLQGRDRFMMNKYIKKKCGFASVVEKDSEVDSWCK